MKFISICSGIEAASVAWHPLGWEAVAFSEIEPFPCALLAHHYPDVPNFGDMTKFREWPEEVFVQADMIVGGPPCQSFSFAGKREGLNDDRGNLTLIYTELIDHADTIRLKHGKPPVTILYENVPGLLSSKDNAFGCFLGALAGEDCELKPSGKRWTNAGYVLGPKRAIAWRILDAQYFGVAQRRRRVFVVASARAGFCPAEVLFEFDGVRRDTAPSREAGQEVTGNVGASFTPSSFGQYQEETGTLRASGGDLAGGSEVLIAAKWPADVASTLNASFGSKLGLENQHIDGGAPLFVPAPAQAFGIPGNWIGRKPENGGNSTQFMHEVAPAQTATDKHGVIAINNCLNPEQPQCWRVYDPNGVAPTLQSGEARGNIISFNSRQDPVSGDVFGALDTCSPQAQAVATVYPINTMTMLGRPSDDLKPRMGLGIGKENDPQNTLSAAHCHAVATQTAVRRLTPIECERLQGFPDGQTAIPWRNKSAEDCPDGHRYKALGNSMAVPVMAWIGRRITAHLGKLSARNTNR